MSKHKRTRKSEAAVVAAIAAELAPTPQLSAKFQLISRAGVQGGRRIQTRLERMIEAGDIPPESGYAGWRFGRDWIMSFGKGRVGWQIERSPVATGQKDPFDTKIDAATRVRAASEALDAAAKPPCAWVTAAEVVRAFVVDDAPLIEISQRCGFGDDRKAKRRLVAYLDILAEHYRAADEDAGRSDAPHSRNAVLQRLQPPLDADEAA
jgi:hypothetical protein